MAALFTGILSILGYLSATFLLLKDLFSAKTRRPFLIIAWIGVFLHALNIALVTDKHQGFNFSFFSTASLISLSIALLLLIAVLDKPVEKLGIVIFPLASLMLGLEIAMPETSFTPVSYSWQMSTHILTSIMAFSLLNIAALQAALLAIQDQQLRSHHPRKLIRSLPPLQAMESLLFQMIGYGLLFLSASLLTGFIFIEDLFAQHLVHKTVLSILAWIIFSCLLIGRSRYGWRGNTAIQWTLIGFILLLLAYFGSKLVLELILKKH
jgi:ABC-type uncharacterized transport system permease subunit